MTASLATYLERWQKENETLNIVVLDQQEFVDGLRQRIDELGPMLDITCQQKGAFEQHAEAYRAALMANFKVCTEALGGEAPRAARNPRRPVGGYLPPAQWT